MDKWNGCCREDFGRNSRQLSCLVLPGGFLAGPDDSFHLTRARILQSTIGTRFNPKL